MPERIAVSVKLDIMLKDIVTNFMIRYVPSVQREHIPPNLTHGNCVSPAQRVERASLRSNRAHLDKILCVDLVVKKSIVI